MGIFRQFPYTNFHDMNLDWLLDNMKNLLTEWSAYQAKWNVLYDDITTAFNDYEQVFNEHIAQYDRDFQTFINSINVTAELRKVFDQALLDGTVSSIINPIIIAETQRWLAENITEPVGVVIDKTLSIEGACADAKATGDAIENVKSFIGNTDTTFTWIDNGWINYGTGGVVESANYKYSDFVPVIADTKIRTNINIAGNAGIAFYDENRNYISGYQATTEGQMVRDIDVPSNSKYARFSCFFNTATIENSKYSVIDIYENILKIDEQSKYNKMLLGDGSYTEIELSITNGVINAGGTYVNDTGCHASLFVEAGDEYLIVGDQISTWFSLGQMLYKGTRVKSIDAGRTGHIDVYRLTIPVGVDEIIINGDHSNPMIFKKASNIYPVQEYGWETLPINATSGVISRTLENVATGNHIKVYVNPNEHYKISGRGWNAYCPRYVFSDGDNVVAYDTGATSEYFTDLEITVPDGAYIMYVNGNAPIGIKAIKYDRIKYESKIKSLENKTMVWFGTSIPQNTTYFEGADWSIPSYAGKLLNMNVINECYGASIGARGIYNKITDNDPYGWTGVSWYAVFRALGANLAEKQDLIENYENKWYDLIGGSTDPLYPGAKPQTLSESLRNEILSCSYENRLMPYLDGRKPLPDLFVFEHGYNDSQATVFSGISPNERNLNRSLYSDAMYFYFQKIFEVNPQAKILIVSHYENTSTVGKKAVDAQKELAEYHGIHFCNVAENIAWSQRLVNTTGYWNNGIWIPNGGSMRTITRLEQAIPDQIHPHTDKSGNAIKREAQIIADYIKNNINLD